MWDVSDRFLDALTKGQRRKTVCTITVPGVENPLVADVKQGQIRVDGSANIRRRVDLTIAGGDDLFDAIRTPGARVNITHGLTFGGDDEELVPVFTGGPVRARQPYGRGRGELTVPLADLGMLLAEADFTDPYQPPSNVDRVEAIMSIVSSGLPGVSFVIEVTSSSSIQGRPVWEGSRWRAINEITAEVGWEAFFLPDGRFCIRDQPTISGPPAWAVRGIITSLDRELPMERRYNRVVAFPTATDGSQTWTRQVVTVPQAHPRHPSKLGAVVPYFLPMPTARSASTAVHAAQTRLDRVIGDTEYLSSEMISNPALECGDQLRLIVPEVGEAPARIFGHLVDSFTLDLASGGMRLDTRSKEVTE